MIEKTIAAEATKYVKKYIQMRKAYPEFEWASSGAMSILSDGIAKQIGKKFGGHVLDGKGVDVPGLKLEITCGRSISKSHGIKDKTKFMWVRRTGKDWEDGFEVRMGEFEPKDFPNVKPGRHGSVVSKATALSKTKIIERV